MGFFIKRKKCRCALRDQAALFVVDIDVVMPWKTFSTQVVSEILIAETIIVGSVPDTYLNVR